MELARRFLNSAEEIVFEELSDIARDNGYRVFAKTRLADAVSAERNEMTSREFSYFLRAHLDFLLDDGEGRPLLAVEFDGPSHLAAEQVERDAIKDQICRAARLPLLRIGSSSQYLKRYRGMSVLRWIVEVYGLQNWFFAGQESGDVPADEIFDPAMIASIGDRREFPYWLSVEDTQRIHRFQDQNRFGHFNWFGFSMDAPDGSIRRMECLVFDGATIYAMTRFKKQSVRIPVHELQHEVTVCELGSKLSELVRGRRKPQPWSSVARYLERHRERLSIPTYMKFSDRGQQDSFG